MFKFLALLISVLLYNFQLAQGCESDESEVVITIIQDNYPSEISWNLKDSDGNVIGVGQSQGRTFCVDSGLCLIFTIFDSFGDGICCGEGNGSYSVTLDGELITTGGQYAYSETTSFNCAPGFSCFDSKEVTEGSYTAPNNNYWYDFTPTATGIYTVSTCDNNTCDTKIWIYDYCSGDLVGQTNEGTLYFDDNEGGCGLQAKVNAYLEANEKYYIRIGSANNICTSPINWVISFGGEIEGCTNPESCNYDPFANVDDGSCVFDGHPDCADVPDLVVLENVLRNSLEADVINNNSDNCMINEGCLQGFGRREIVRFSTHIKNIGDLDFFIGSPNNNPGQFSFDNCHNHNHYEGYAEYRLANAANELLPIGFKNGFCVLDLECSDGGTPKFGCGNMGITAHCGDIYSSYLQCQWVDVTGLPAGDYTLVVTVNWDRSPDALGNYETNYVNNWAQVCFTLSRDANNNHSVSLIPLCSAYVDCEGTPYGNAQLDCLGNCNGSSVYGDLDGNGTQNAIDAQEYIDNIVDGGMEATSCFDLFADNEITVYDAALLNSCSIYGTGHDHPNDGNIHNHCNLPGGVSNPLHTVSLTILEADFTNKTIDIGILNPYDYVVAYEFNMSGILIESVTNLVDPNEYPITPEYFVGGTKVIGMSLLDSSITKSNGDFQPLCRIKFSEITGSEICIEDIIDIVNAKYHKVNDSIINGCTEILTGLDQNDFVKQMSIYPNPSKGIFNVQYELSRQTNFDIEVTNNLGQIIYVQPFDNSLSGQIKINLEKEAAGIYFIKFVSENSSFMKKLILGE